MSWIITLIIVGIIIFLLLIMALMRAASAILERISPERIESKNDCGSFNR